MFHNTDEDKSAKNRLIEKFETYGSLGQKELALWIAAKQWVREQKKPIKKIDDKKSDKSDTISSSNIYVFMTEDISKLAEQIKRLIDHGISDKFEFVLGATPPMGLTHWIFGEIVVDCRDKQNIQLKILLDDPLKSEYSKEASNKPEQMLKNFIYWSNFDLASLKSDYVKIQFYLANSQLQHTPTGCAVISVLACLMLSNQDEFMDIYRFMENHKSKRDVSIAPDVTDILNGANAITSQTTGRLGRMKFRKEGPDGLNQLVNDPDIGKEKVNKKGETAYEIGNKHFGEEVFWGGDDHGTIKSGNIYVKHKLEQARDNLRKYLCEETTAGNPDNSVTRDGSDVDTVVKKHYFSALENRIDQLIANQKKKFAGETKTESSSTGTVLKDLTAAAGQNINISDRTNPPATEPTTASSVNTPSAESATETTSKTKEKSKEEVENSHTKPRL